MKIPTPLPSQPGSSMPFLSHKNAKPLRDESLGSQPASWPNIGLDGWEDDGGSVAKVGTAWPTFNLYG